MADTAIMDMLPISDVSFTLQWQQETSQQGSGAPRAADIGEELWIAEIGCSVLTAPEYREAEARISALRGAIGTFYLHNARAPYPLADLNGALLGNDEVTIYALGGDNKSLRFAGLKPGYVLSIGDFFHFDTGTIPNVRRCLHRLTGATVADGNGRTGLVAVEPHIRAGAAPAVRVEFRRPAAEMFILPGTYRAQSQKSVLGSLNFTALQVP